VYRKIKTKPAAAFENIIPIRPASNVVTIMTEPHQQLTFTKGVTVKKSYENMLIRNFLNLLRMPVILNLCIINISYISCSAVGTTVFGEALNQAVHSV
jgi:hypothetical protein